MLLMHVYYYKLFSIGACIIIIVYRLTQNIQIWN